MLVEERREVAASHLLLALDHELEIDGDIGPGRQARLERLDVHVDLPLVVDRAAGVQAAIADLRVERRARPQLVGFRGLHVVVPVHEHGRGLGGVDPFADDDGMPPGLDDLGLLHPRREEVLRDPVRARADVARVSGIRADAGNAEKGLQFLVKARQLAVDMGGEIGHVAPGRIEGNLCAVAVRACDSTVGVIDYTDEEAGGKRPRSVETLFGDERADTRGRVEAEEPAQGGEAGEGEERSCAGGAATAPAAATPPG